MTDESQLQVRPKDGDSSLSLSKVRSGLIARGLSDAASLAGPSSPESTRRPDVTRLERWLSSKHDRPALVRQLADEGHAVAQFVLGFMYHEGQGVPQDYAEAARWYRKAADQENAHARFNLGVMYRGGQGVPQDYVQAHVWFDLAASGARGDGQKEYADARDLVGQKMSSQQIAEALRLAAEWKPKPSR